MVIDLVHGFVREFLRAVRPANRFGKTVCPGG
jgi:hypothetical protein